LQLALAGFLLKYVFEFNSVWLVLAMAGLMIFTAGREVLSRQRFKLKGANRDSLTAMIISSMAVSITVTGVVIAARPWWHPPLFIPLLGMILGNSLNGISLALNHFLTSAHALRSEIEGRLCLGATPNEATSGIIRDAIRTGMIPAINAMAIVGIVSLPGMMTGQLLAGANPADAVMYQIVVMYMLTGAAGIGSVAAVLLIRKRLFSADMAFSDGFKDNGSSR